MSLPTCQTRRRKCPAVPTSHDPLPHLLTGSVWEPQCLPRASGFLNVSTPVLNQCIELWRVKSHVTNQLSEESDVRSACISMEVHVSLQHIGRPGMRICASELRGCLHLIHPMPVERKLRMIGIEPSFAYNHLVHMSPRNTRCTRLL